MAKRTHLSVLFYLRNNYLTWIARVSGEKDVLVNTSLNGMLWITRQKLMRQEEGV